MEKAEPPTRIIGVLCMLLGMFPILIAADLIPGAAHQLAAPRWVAACAGAVFVLAGAMILLRRNARLVDALAAVLCFLFGAIGMWVAVFSPKGGIVGGIPLISADTNSVIGRIVFGLGALISFALSLYAIRRAVTRRS
jgi:hypothetical protein